MRRNEAHELRGAIDDEDRTERGPDRRAGAVQCELHGLARVLRTDECVHDVAKEGDVRGGRWVRGNGGRGGPAPKLTPVAVAGQRRVRVRIRLSPVKARPAPR